MQSNMNIESKITVLVEELKKQNYTATGLNFNYQKLEDFTHLLLKWNNSHDLVSQKSFLEIFDHHIVDTIAAFIVQRNYSDKLPDYYLDIGSGAGLPGIVWHLCFGENAKTVLIEPREKRINFLKEVRRSLKLKNLDFISERFKELPDKNELTVASIRALKPDQFILDSICLTGNANNKLIWLGSGNSEMEVSEKIKFQKIEYSYNLAEKYRRSILIYDRF